MLVSCNTKKSHINPKEYSMQIDNKLRSERIFVLQKRDVGYALMRH